MTIQLSEEYLYRFGGLARLYGRHALPWLAQAHFAVIGLGGVGSWAAEALARSGIGQLTLIDLDDVCITNTNRQSHTLVSTVGQTKLKATTDRLLQINPQLIVHGIDDFLLDGNISTYIGRQHDVVIDATDATRTKAALAAYCSAVKIRLIMVGSSGGKQDPGKIQVADLAQTENDPLLARIRMQLYRRHNFAKDRQRKFRIDAVYSTERMVYPKPDGSVCERKQFVQGGTRLDCTTGYGSSVMVTGSFGFVAASRAIDRYLRKKSAALQH